MNNISKQFHQKKLLSKIYITMRKAGRARNLAIILFIAIIIALTATYSVIVHGGSAFGVNPKHALALILTDLILLLALAGIITKRLARLVVERRKRTVGSRLQVRIVVMFSLVAIVPAIVMGVFSAILFNFGIQSWFNDRVQSALQGSVAIAERYLDEHKQIIRADILGVANDLNRDAYNIRRKPQYFSKKLSILTGIRKLPEAIVFQTDGENRNILARTQLSFTLELVLRDVAKEIIDQAGSGGVITLTNDNDDRVMALIQLENYLNTYLLVGRFVDNSILNHIALTEGAAAEYELLFDNMSQIQIQFFIVFVIVALLLLLVVVWFGLIFALDLVHPISNLIGATEKVKKGNYSVRVEEGPEDDEVATLGRAFNNMAKQLDRQRLELSSVQRHAAWSDVARRIAHEIKNPLTPIQLSAERLKRKYVKKLADDEVFEKYVSTIIRNVNDIGKMVEEFVSFARIPAPEFNLDNVNHLISEAVFAREVASPNIVFRTKLPKKNVMLHMDSTQISRVLTNILKNAEESLLEGGVKEPSVEVSLIKKGKKCCIEVTDNGKGFSENMIDRLTEPYVTTKSKGTGLGLAIVKKIIEDHQGTIVFSNNDTGACVTITLPVVGD